jgi:hypothetical protein
VTSAVINRNLPTASGSPLAGRAFSIADASPKDENKRAFFRRPAEIDVQPNADESPRALLNVVTSLVRSRRGSVLARNTILKMDHFPSGTNTKLDFHLQGAPNFRLGQLNVYGVAQPTVSLIIRLYKSKHIDCTRYL